MRQNLSDGFDFDLPRTSSGDASHPSETAVNAGAGHDGSGTYRAAAAGDEGRPPSRASAMLMHEWIEQSIVNRLEGVSIGFGDLINIPTPALCPAPPSPMNTVSWAAALAAAMSDWRPLA
jgi:hypothetical protein